MTNAGIGIDYANVGCLKITRGSFDPLTTNDSERYKFLYNSKWAKDVRVQDVRTTYYGLARGFHAVELNWDVYSSGPANPPTYPQLEILKRNLFGGGKGLSYQLPLFQSATLDGNGYYIGRRAVTSFTGTNQDTQRFDIREGTYDFEDKLISAGANWVIQYGGGSFDQFTVDAPHVFNTPNRRLTFWNLPGDNTAIENGSSLPPVSGQPQVIISPSALRVSKPGFNANSASGTQLAVDTSQLPCKIIAAMDVDVPSGSSSVNIGYSIPSDSVIDLHFYKSGEPVWYPSGPYGELIGAFYRIVGNTVEFSNPGIALRARFIIMAANSSPRTAGSNSVFRQFTENGVDVIQFLRPGSGPNPSFADIAIDSRWPAVQIVAEGYLPIDNGTNRETSISYDASGLFTFVKFVTVHGAGRINPEGSTRYATINGMIRLPQVTMWRRTGGSTGGWPGGYIMGGNTCICRYTQTGATFVTSKGDPMYQSLIRPGGGGQRIDSFYDEPPIAGVRYYVFGIATG